MSRLSEEYDIRQEKITKAEKAGWDLYPARTLRNHSIKQTLTDFDRLADEKKEIVLAGRVKTVRLHGGSCFAHINDGSEQMQIYVKKDNVGEKEYEFLKDIIDIGDFIELTGTLFTTKKGEKTLMVSKLQILSKALRPLPEKWHGLSDVEIRYRQRYLDLIANSEVKEVFIKRSHLINEIRSYLNKADFIEVETPTLQSIPGGANAKPFITHHNALDIDLYLRIAPELYLKRLIIGGFEKVFEIAKCFRNEGVDRDHNPEFTQVEFYAAYWDYEMMMDFTEKMLTKIVKEVNGELVLDYFDNKINFTPPYERINFQQACKKYAQIDIDKEDEKSLIKTALAKGVKLDTKTAHKAKVLDEIFKEFVRPNLIQPTFITDHPIELSPLAKKKKDNPNYAERFQLVIGGIELCNAFSELNDPIDQQKRFEYQEKQRQAGDDEAQRIDHDFIEALSYGMPPTAGIGIGIDRLAALLCQVSNLKKVILFPTLKPKQ